MRLIALYIFCLAVFFDSSRSAKIDRFETVCRQLNDLSICKDSVFTVRNFTLERDAATFTFHEGNFYVLSRVNNTISSLIFIGEGTFSFVPSTDIEQKHLRRFLGKERLNETFHSVFLLFTDSTFDEISRHHTIIPSSVPSAANSMLTNARKYIRNDDLTRHDFDVLRAFLPQFDHDWFYSHIVTEEYESLFYEIDNMEVEEVTLSHVSGAYRGSISPYVRETICSFHKRIEYSQKESLNDEYKSTFAPIHYDIDMKIEDDLNSVVRCDMYGKNLRFKCDWLDFRIVHDVIVDSVLNGKGISVPFVKEKESSILWVHDPAMFSTVDTLHFVFYYRGEIFHKIDFWKELKQSNLWYPSVGNIGIDRFTYDMTFHYPADLMLISAGKQIHSSTVDDITTSQWSITTPTFHSSFALGKFEEYAGDFTGSIPIKFYSSANYQHTSLLSGDFRENMAYDLQNSVRFFSHIFGAPPIDELKAVEIAGGHGQAFPNLLHLSWYTFQTRRAKEKGSDQAFRAHEVAHMWWGLGVSWKSYHDYWLSEAFAEYSGLWYMQTALRDNETFFKRLEEYKRSILGSRKYLLSSGQESGPVWLGSRTQSSNTAGDYSLIVYKKGSWILHMLRNLAIDLKTMKEDVFQNLLSEFYRTYNGRNASTEDFQKVTEKYFGTSMQWFFDQWVYNTDIPTYTIMYKKEDLPGGKYRVHCTVKQSNVPDDFQMYVPFLIDFGDNKLARLRYLIKGPVTEFDFPVLPLEPREIKFNDLESVLCEIDDEDWE